MKLEDKLFAEKVLRKLFIGSQLDGIKFGIGPGAILLYFMHYTNQDVDELWLNIEDKFTIFPNRTSVTINMEELAEEAAFQSILQIRREKVIAIELGDELPHLFITFESGKVLVINGSHEKYECWQAGDGRGHEEDDYLIVAIPGNEIAIWASEEVE